MKPIWRPFLKGELGEAKAQPNFMENKGMGNERKKFKVGKGKVTTLIKVKDRQIN
jgi:hypothetical protein